MLIADLKTEDKIFLSYLSDIQQDYHGNLLERTRDSLLTNAVVVLQRATKRFLRHKKRQKQTCAAVLIQKIWKGYHDKKAYLQVYDPLMQKTIMLSHYFLLINSN